MGRSSRPSRSKTRTRSCWSPMAAKMIRSPGQRYSYCRPVDPGVTLFDTAEDEQVVSGRAI